MSDIKDTAHLSNIDEGDLGRVADSLDGMKASASLQAHEVDNVGAVVDEVMKMMIAEMDERLADKGVKTSALEKLKIRGMKKGLELAQKYSAKFNAEARVDKIVADCNKALPTLIEMFGEQALVSRIPPKVRDPHVVLLCEKAGATELAGLIRRSIPVMQPAAVQPR